MNKYNLIGLKIETVKMEVKAKNLTEAIEKCYTNYDIEEVDGNTTIFVNDKKLVDKNGDEVYLCDIPNSEQHLY